MARVSKSVRHRWKFQAICILNIPQSNYSRWRSTCFPPWRNTALILPARLHTRALHAHKHSLACTLTGIFDKEACLTLLRDEMWENTMQWAAACQVDRRSGAVGNEQRLIASTCKGSGGETKNKSHSDAPGKRNTTTVTENDSHHRWIQVWQELHKVSCWSPAPILTCCHPPRQNWLASPWIQHPGYFLILNITQHLKKKKHAHLLPYLLCFHSIQFRAYMFFFKQIFNYDFTAALSQVSERQVWILPEQRNSM